MSLTYRAKMSWVPTSSEDVVKVAWPIELSGIGGEISLPSMLMMTDPVGISVLGAPLTVPCGNTAWRTSHGDRPGARAPSTWETRCITCE